MNSLVARIWRTGLDGSRADDYDEFAHTRSLPMFERHDGFRGVLFAAAGDERVVITLWQDREAASALEHSSDYQATVRAIQEAGFLRPPQHVELLDVRAAQLASIAM
jgi:heme-degrading monooxygenase HmoA